MTARRVNFDIRQSGKPIALVMLAWLALNVGFYVVAVRPKVEQYTGIMTGKDPVAQQVKILKKRVDTQESFLQGLEQFETDLQHLRTEVLSTRDLRLVQVHAELESLCNQFKIDLETIDYSNKVLLEEGIDQHGMDVPLTAGYGNLRQFLHAVESSSEFLVVESIKLRQGEVGLELRINMVTYFEASPAELQRLRHMRGGARRRS